MAQARHRSKIDHYTQVAGEVYDYVVNVRFPIKKPLLLCQIIYSWSYSKTHLIIIFSTLRFDELSRLEPLYDTTFRQIFKRSAHDARLMKLYLVKVGHGCKLVGHGNVT